MCSLGLVQLYPRIPTRPLTVVELVKRSAHHAGRARSVRICALEGAENVDKRQVGLVRNRVE